MWQLLLKILEFVEWQYYSSLHKRGPKSAPLRRYKSWNTSLESGELVQICTLWEQKLAHKECKLAVLYRFFTWFALLPTSFATLLLFWYWQALDFMGRWDLSPFHRYSLPWSFHSRGVAKPEIGEVDLHLSSAFSTCVNGDSQHGQTKSPMVCKKQQNSFLLLSSISTNHGLLLPGVSTPGLCIKHLNEAFIWKCLLPLSHLLCSSRKWRWPEETLCSTVLLLHKDARYYLSNASCCLEKYCWSKACR